MLGAVLSSGITSNMQTELFPASSIAVNVIVEELLPMLTPELGL